MTKERVREYKHLKRETAQIEAHLHELRSSAALRSQALTGMPTAHGNGHSPVEAAVAAIVDLEADYIEKLTALHKEQLAIEQAIASLDDSVERQLMRAYYIDGLIWEEVCLVIVQSKDHDIRVKEILHLILAKRLGTALDLHLHDRACLLR